MAVNAVEPAAPGALLDEVVGALREASVAWSAGGGASLKDANELLLLLLLVAPSPPCVLPSLEVTEVRTHLPHLRAHALPASRSLSAATHTYTHIRIRTHTHICRQTDTLSTRSLAAWFTIDTGLKWRKSGRPSQKNITRIVIVEWGHGYYALLTCIPRSHNGHCTTIDNNHLHGTAVSLSKTFSAHCILGTQGLGTIRLRARLPARPHCRP